MPTQPPQLSAQEARRACDPAGFDFDTTADLPELQQVLGQPRALVALELSTGIAHHGFNLFALGPPGSGKTTLVCEYLERRAAERPVPPDLCYVHNFADARRPAALRLPAGRGPGLRRDIADLIAELKVAIPRAFDSQEYQDQRSRLIGDLEEKQRQEFARLEVRVHQFGFSLLKAPGGLVLTPAVEGKPLGEQDLEKLSDEQRDQLVEIRERLERDVEVGLRNLRELEKGAREALRQLDQATAAFATQHRVEELRSRYQDLQSVLHYLDSLQAEIIEHSEEFRKDADSSTQPPAPTPPEPPEHRFSRYEVNVVVDNSRLSGAPVVVENNPTFFNLVGRMEHTALWGTVVTDFTLIKAGALHRANGGYLVIPARECLLNPYAWDGLKRALKDEAVRIEELGSQLGLLSTVTLEPEPVPLDVKVVLIGNPILYNLLYTSDEDFRKLFKVKADFTTQMERTAEAESGYALFVATIAQHDHALPFERGAAARLVEYGSRLAGDQDKLSTRFGEIADLVREAAYCAGQNGHGAVSGGDVRQAEEARRYRQNLVEENVQEAIRRGTLLVETQGTALGRINGLSVVMLGDYAFGHPSRITATVAPGWRGVVSIEREVELSGPIHGKGVLILGGYLMHQYGSTGPLALSASLVFEQNYGGVEGDSASLAELYALLSALAGVPLRQDIAVTGSVNQHGQVQPVGGVTEKIEGFFDICCQKGLTGEQGVLIPAANRRSLMLRDEVVAAVREGRFHIWIAGHVDDGLPLLTGLEAGGLSGPGEYSQGTLHRAAADQLARYADILRSQGVKIGANGHAEREYVPAGGT